MLSFSRAADPFIRESHEGAHGRQKICEEYFERYPKIGTRGG
jgi:hypothetical protein